ncbi:MAG: hypothetical protein M0R48_03940 [Candidatus Omnitrophica bacterium]|nr:hypothetical protein [Candidatus Omnitrophota bacterium]
MSKKFFLIINVMIFLFIGNMGFPLPAQENNDPFEVKPESNRPNCDKEYRFKYGVKINSADEFIGFLKAHQSERDLYDFQPTQEFLLPRYTLEAKKNKDTENSINLDNLEAKVETIDLQHSKLSNKKIFILRVWFKDFKENYPWQILIKASDNGYFSVKFCAGI